ncbi:hypothetical protein QGP82_27410 [Leptothoe sp. LEGE 181152]|nr:hypothetical protein [Leptothoe sp. LEGE 181152]
MGSKLLVRDETTLGQSSHSLMLTFSTERITVQELIRSRIYQEVKDYNVKLSDHFHGLVKPTEAEQTLNGYKLRLPRKIDWEKQYEQAIEAFLGNGFIVLVDDQQVDSLEEQIEIRSNTSVSFLKLVPLVGG